MGGTHYKKLRSVTFDLCIFGSDKLCPFKNKSNDTKILMITYLILILEEL